MFTNIILATAFQNMIWIVLLIAFVVTIYVWSKSKIANKTVAVLITLVLAYFIFIRYPELVWIVALGVIIYWIYGADIKKSMKLKI